MATWPTTLPQKPLQQGYKYTYPDNVLRTNMSVGPAKQRVRARVNTRNISVSMYLTEAELSDFDTFYETTTSYGSIAFDWIDPISEDTKSFRFIGGSPPSRTPLSGGDWLITFEIEEMP